MQFYFTDVEKQHETLNVSSPIPNVADTNASNPIVMKEAVSESSTNLSDEEILLAVINVFEKILSENSDACEVSVFPFYCCTSKIMIVLVIKIIILIPIFFKL